MNKTTSLFIVPRASTAWRGSEGIWIMASGWAGAGKQLWDEAIVATTDGVFEPHESMLFPRSSNTEAVNPPLKKPRYKKMMRNLIPEIFITAFKDWQLKSSKPQVWPVEASGKLDNKEVKLIWERHDLFPGPGRKLADKYEVPLVTSVDALVVWEAGKWGVKRPFWGKWLEKNIEVESLKRADLICCISKEVRKEVISMGIDKGKVIVTPNRVDANLFHPNIDGSEIEEKYNLKDKRVLGWTGSFRSFHALDHIVLAFEKVHKKHSDIVLMLVGDGAEFEKIEKMVREKGLSDAVIMPGRKAFIEISRYVANFHISLVSARSSEGFHYSPLKLREYLAAGRAVIAPDAGDLAEVFEDNKELLFYEAGNFESLAQKMSELLDNPEKQKKLSKNATEWFEREGSWTHELKRVCRLLDISF